MERVLDKNDPNYDSDEERAVVLRTQHQKLKEEVSAYKQQVRCSSLVLGTHSGLCGIWGRGQGLTEGGNAVQVGIQPAGR